MMTRSPGDKPVAIAARRPDRRKTSTERSQARPPSATNTFQVSPRRNSAPVGTIVASSCVKTLIFVSSWYPSPKPLHCSGGDKMSSKTLTRCSSTPSVDILVNAELNPTDPPRQRHRPTPILDHDLRARSNFDCIGTEHVDNDFQIMRVADLDDGRTGLHDGLTLLRHLKHKAGDWRSDIPD